MLAVKKCNTCGEKLALSLFYRHSGNTDGRLGRCKECHKAGVRAAREARPEHYREFDKKRASLPHRIAARKAYAATDQGIEATRRGQFAWIERNPEKRKAHIALNNALRDKRIERLSCEICGEERSEAHHNDYSNPLGVRWLCKKHHIEIHKSEDEMSDKPIPEMSDAELRSILWTAVSPVTRHAAELELIKRGEPTYYGGLKVP